MVQFRRRHHETVAVPSFKNRKWANTDVQRQNKCGFRHEIVQNTNFKNTKGSHKFVKSESAMPTIFLRVRIVFEPLARNSENPKEGSQRKNKLKTSKI